MKIFARNIFIIIGIITLTTISMIPVFVYAQSTASTPNAVTNFGDAVIGITNFVTGITPLLYTLMSLAAAAMGLAGLFLDFILKISILDLSQKLDSITSINTTWKVIRDLANMSFIFILLYEGIRMVVGLGESNIKKLIGNIVVAAILVNFSLFFTKVVIDASNIITLGFYNAIVGTGNTVTGLAGVLMNVLRLNTVGLFSVKGVIGTALDGANGITILIGNTIFLLIGTFVFLAISIMFVIRYLSFIILLIMSPMAFVSMAIPGLNDLKEKYVKTLTSQALFAPVFMLLTWVMLTLAGDSGFLSSISTADRSWWQVITNTGRSSSDTISTIVDYILLIGLLLQTLILSKSVSTKAGFVTKDMVNKGTGWLGGAVFGGTARAGTQTLGRIGRAVADSDTLREQVKEGGVRGWIAKKTLQTGKWTADASFDARNSSTLGDQLSKAGAGKGLKGGYDTYLKNKIKEDEELLKLIKPSARAVAEAEAKLKDDANKEKWKKERDDYFASDTYAQVLATEKAKRQKTLSDIEKSIRDQNAKLTQVNTELTQTTQTVESSAEYIALQAKLAAATTEEQRKVVEAEIEEARKPITTASAKIDAIRRLIETKEEEKRKAMKELDIGFNSWQQAQYESWISKEQEELIAIKGGQDEKKYGGKGALKDQIKTREVTSKTDEYAKTIGERIGNQRTAWTLGFGIPEFSKERGRALKKGIKKKKSIEDTIKEQVKEEANTEGDSSDQTPPASPATPPPTAPTP